MSAVHLHFRAHSPRCLEHPRIDLDLFHTRSEECLQCRRYPRLFACTGRSIDEQMREVTAGRLVYQIVSSVNLRSSRSAFAESYKCFQAIGQFGVV
jgi:hypothetical protein